MSDEKGSPVLRILGGLVGCLGLVAVGGTLALCAGLFGVGTAINSTPLSYTAVASPRSVNIYSGRLAGYKGSEPAAALIMDWVQERASLSFNGLNILFQHGWYNAITSGYELQVWIESDQPRTYDSYALYQSGSTVFFRNEADYSNGNRVLTVDWTADELQTALEPLMTAP